MKTLSKSQKYFLGLVWIIVGSLGRLIPHPANFTPTTALGLFAGSKLPRWFGLISLIILLLLSDLGIAYLQHIPVFGPWTWFSYTGFIAIYFLGRNLEIHSRFNQIFSITLISSIGYWLWTNLGVWLTTTMYPQSITGLLNCYIAAIPFLRNALLGDLLWVGIIFGSFSWLPKLKQSLGSIKL